jgi:hypothetical protein
MREGYRLVIEDRIFKDTVIRIYSRVKDQKSLEHLRNKNVTMKNSAQCPERQAIEA